MDCEVGLYPTEYVNTISISGVPEHAITLKKGAIYMITTNLNKYMINGKAVAKLLHLMGDTKQAPS